MIYIYKEMNQFTKKDYNANQILLSAERRIESEHFAFYENKKQSMLAYLLLRYALFRECGSYSEPKISKADSGKPYLPDQEGVYINLSHCNAGVMCGVSKYEIGVDIQEYVHYEENDFRSVLTQKERTVIDSRSSDAEFTKIWTLKESYGKYTGEGITYSLDRMDFSGIDAKWSRRYGHLFSAECCEKTANAACTEEELKRINVSYDELMEVLKILRHFNNC